MIALLLATGATMFVPPRGAYDPNATATTVCRFGYTRAERERDTYEVRDRIYSRYGIRRGQRFGRFVIDHLIPLELGGVTDDRNLWPQPLEESYRKDDDENRLHREVCAGRMTLDAARAAILRLWGRR